MSEVTLLLEEIARGNRDVEGKLLEVVYPELHRLASAFMRRERPDHTLRPTALINEAYLRLVGRQPRTIESRLHFLNIAAQIMRRILIDHARGAQARKRAAGNRLELDESMAISVDDPDPILAIDQAITRLTAVDTRLAQVVELRYFGGFSVDETAEILKMSPKTVKRDWALARAWLEDELRTAATDAP
ncbi:MAG: sigma-70 family RNA polymerase sigma factor [Acidobacteria bacterium]|nr:sigma-70 family RNA polymerase sigma factor [Acidobacteriota bacterium]